MHKTRRSRSATDADLAGELVRDGREWVTESGYRFPVLSGGADEPADEPADDGDGDEPVTLTKAEVAELRAAAEGNAGLTKRINELAKRAESRPPSTLEALVAELEEARGLKTKAADGKHKLQDAKVQAGSAVHKLQVEIRETKATTAIENAGFRPDAVEVHAAQLAAMMEADEELDVKAAAAALAAKHKYALKPGHTDGDAKQGVKPKPSGNALTDYITDSRA